MEENEVKKPRRSRNVSTGNQTSKQNSSDKAKGKSSDKVSSGQTRTFKHVDLEKKRPQLTRDPEASHESHRNQRKKRSGKSQRPKAADAQLRVIPLGGLDAIGKNMTVLECGNDMILDDAGIMFPGDEHPGIDLILPDYSYVLEHADKLRGIVITHGHEDHTGSLPYLIKDLDRPVPIYGTKMTLGLIQGKFNEHRIKNAQLIEIKPGDKVELGCFGIEFFSVNHSIPGAVGIFFQSPAGNVLHTGDFKLDQSPIDGVTTDFGALARFGEIGVDLMMSDSTNAQNKAFTPSESEVGRVLNDIIAQAKGRVIIATFASHIHRMQQICDAAVANGRKVVVTGRSMIQNTDIARQLGYLDIADSDLIDAYELKGTPPDRVVIMSTGSQGEPLSALSRIAGGRHKTISIDAGDTIIISATPVPGNEKAVTRIINLLSKIGADVYDKSRAMVHVSGHAGSEELKLVLSIVQPKHFMPVHGEAAHLRAHANLARQTGIADEDIFILENGESLVLKDGDIELGESVQSGVVFVDGLSVGDTSQDVLDERILLGAQGIATIAAAIDMTRCKMKGYPAIEMHGITGGDDEYLPFEAQEVVEAALNRQLSKGGRASELKKASRDALLQLIWERTKQKPIVVSSIIEV